LNVWEDPWRGCALDFNLADEESEVRDAVREFAEEEIRPPVRGWDEVEHLSLELLPKLAQSRGCLSA